MSKSIYQNFRFAIYALFMAIFLFCSEESVNGQANNTSQSFQKYYVSNPPIDGYFFCDSNRKDPMIVYNPNMAIDLYSHSKTIYSSGAGNVFSLIKYGSVYLIVIKYDSTVFVYRNVLVALVKKGQDVKQNQAIGKLKYDADSSKYMLSFQAYVLKKNVPQPLWQDELIKILHANICN